MNYIKCTATPTNLSLLSTKSISATTDTRIVIYGDANLDGFVNIIDVTAIQHYIAGDFTFTPEQMIAADVNGDGVVDNSDITCIQNYILHNID
jgi:hypothetical protein